MFHLSSLLGPSQHVYLYYKCQINLTGLALWVTEVLKPLPHQALSLTEDCLSTYEQFIAYFCIKIAGLVQNISRLDEDFRYKNYRKRHNSSQLKRHVHKIWHFKVILSELTLDINLSYSTSTTNVECKLKASICS